MAPPDRFERGRVDLKGRAVTLGVFGGDLCDGIVVEAVEVDVDVVG